MRALSSPRNVLHGHLNWRRRWSTLITSVNISCFARRLRRYDLSRQSCTVAWKGSCAPAVAVGAPWSSVYHGFTITQTAFPGLRGLPSKSPAVHIVTKSFCSEIDALYFAWSIRVLSYFTPPSLLGGEEIMFLSCPSVHPSVCPSVCVSRKFVNMVFSTSLHQIYNFGAFGGTCELWTD